MARARVKNGKRFAQAFVRSYKKSLNRNISRENKNLIEKEIIATILGGQSPVKGKRFKQYSEAYAKREKGGARKPVNMFLSGKMLDSLEVKQVRGRDGILIRFKDRLADIHNRRGAGTSRVIRRLLPFFSKGEQFKRNIATLINRFVLNVVRKSSR